MTQSYLHDIWQTASCVSSDFSQTDMSTALNSISNLPDYSDDVEHLDAAIVFEQFKSCVEDLESDPRYITAHAACKTSRRILYALEENAWQDGSSNVGYINRLEDVSALFRRALAMKNDALSGSAQEEREDVKTFLGNIAERYKELKKRAE